MRVRFVDDYEIERFLDESNNLWFERLLFVMQLPL